MRVIRKIADICRQVPMLPITIVAALFVALLWNYRPWQSGVAAVNIGNFVAAPPVAGAWHIGPFAFNPSVGQVIVVLLVAYSVFDSIRGMIASLKAGHVGIDVLAILALLSTLGVQEYWASWAVVLMIWSGEAIESYAQTKAESNLSALVAAAPQMAHISDLPGVGSTGKPLTKPHVDKAAPQNNEPARRTENDKNSYNANHKEDVGNVGETAGQPCQPDKVVQNAAVSTGTIKPNAGTEKNHLDALFANTDRRLADGFPGDAGDCFAPRRRAGSAK